MYMCTHTYILLITIITIILTLHKHVNIRGLSGERTSGERGICNDYSVITCNSIMYSIRIVTACHY